MPLTNKYLKYCPEITFEIFTLVWDKLLENGWKQFANNNIQQAWNEFKTRGSTGDIKNKVFFQHENIIAGYKNASEITVQEILGYDPFIKEFVLPESWYIRLTKDNLNIITDWFNTFAKLNRNPSLGSYVGKANKNTKGVVLENGYAYFCDSKCFDTEITFDQFKKYVLKETTEIPKEVIPEYVELLEGFDNTRTGKIFDTKNVIPLMNDWSSLWTWESIFKNDLQRQYFKPSTKEAFDAQNQPKQPLKQAVHCKTQEEWDFVTEKLGNDDENWFIDPDWGNNKSFCISFEDKNQSQTLDFYQNAGYQILSFQEWCDLNGYKMENEVKFEVEKWYCFKTHLGDPRKIKCSNIDEDYVYCSSYSIADMQIYACENAWRLNSIKHESIKELSIEEIQQYLPEGHPDKIKVNREFKVGDWVICIGEKYGNNGELNQLYKIVEIEYEKYLRYEKSKSLDITQVKVRHATPEEINNHLISIGEIQAEPVCTNTNSSRHNSCGEKYGCKQDCDECDYYQIPVGEPLNIGIQPTKDGSFKYTTYNGSTFASKVSTVSGPLKMILSIDDEELPMVNIIKTKTVNLLNND